jgi:hypothetical protein
MIPTKNHYSLLNPFFSGRRHDNSDFVRIDGVVVPVVTLKTYRPDTSSKDILVTIGLDPDQFVKYEDEYEIKYIIHIPWDMDISGEWIRAHGAVDINTGTPAQTSVKLDPWVKRAIDWLNNSSYPNEGFDHPLDKDRLKAAANELKELKAKIEREAIIAYCLSISIQMGSAIKIFNCFYKAQTRACSLQYNEYPLDSLKKVWQNRD